MAPRKSRPGKKMPSLKGGIGDAPLTPEQMISVQANRLEINRPTTLDDLRKRMLVKQQDSRLQIAEATVAAARQHAVAPDEGSRLYGRAFQSLPESSRAQLLEILPDDADRQLVRQSFGDYIDADTGATDAPQNLETSAGRADATAREALQSLESRLGVERVPVVDLDATLPPEPSAQTYVPLSAGEQMVTSQGNDWTRNQRERGWRRVVYTPDKAGGAPRQVLEVLADRADEFTTEPPAQTPARSNPDYGKSRDVIRTRSAEEIAPTVDRLTPSSFESLSEDARRAAAQGAEIYEAIEQFEKYNPDFQDTAEAKRLQQRLGELLRQHPEIDAFVDNPTLMSRPVPHRIDTVEGPKGRAALPNEMRLGYVTGKGDPAEYRGDRRTRGDVPADAPNRMGWMEYNEKTAQGRDVRLPRSDEVGSNKDPERKNLDYKGRTEPRRSLEGPQSVIDDAIEATDAELLEALGESEFGPVFAESDTGVPVQDATAGMNPREIARMGIEDDPTAYELRKGTATGSPARVKSDRDLALREGRSFVEKIQEKLFRLAMEMQDAGMVDAGRVREGGGMFDTPEGVTDQFMSELTGSEQVARRSGSPPPRVPGELLKLDGLVPAWRANMAFMDGDEVVIRRPNAYEVAGFLLDRFDIGEPSMALQLEPAVRKAMEFYEAQPPKPNSKAARLAGQTLAPGARYRADIEKTVMSRRSPGDTRPVFSPEVQAALEAPSAATGTFKRLDDQPAGPALVAAQPAPASMPTPMPQQALPQDASQPVQRGLFADMLAAAQNKGTKNITGLLAMLGAGAGAAQAEGGELPPVEYLAMAKASRPRRTPAAMAAGAKPGAGAPSAPQPGTTQAVVGQGVAPSVAQPLPAGVNLGAGVPTGVSTSAMPSPAATSVDPALAAIWAQATPSQPIGGASPAIAAQPPVNIPAQPAAPPAPTPSPKPSMAARASNYFTDGPLGPDPVAQGVKALGKVGYEAGRYFPTAAAALIGAPIAYNRVPQLLQWYAGLFGDGSQETTTPPAAAPAAPADESMESIFQNYQSGEQPSPPPAPAMNQTTNAVGTLRNMLQPPPANRQAQQVMKRYLTDVDLPFQQSYIPQEYRRNGY